MRKRKKPKPSKEQRRNSYLLRKYGITHKEYETILAAQEGVCWICRRPPGKVRLSVDHKHEKGEKKKSPLLIRMRCRGVICWKCNSGLQKFRDNAEAASRAGEYLATWPAQRFLSGEPQK